MLLHEPFMQLQIIWFGKPGDESMPYPEQSIGVAAWIPQFAFAALLTVIFSSRLSRKIFGVVLEPTWAERALDWYEGAATPDAAAATQASDKLGKGDEKTTQLSLPVVAAGPAEAVAARGGGSPGAIGAGTAKSSIDSVIGTSSSFGLTKRKGSPGGEAANATLFDGQTVFGCPSDLETAISL